MSKHVLHRKLKNNHQGGHSTGKKYEDEKGQRDKENEGDLGREKGLSRLVSG